MASNPQPSVLEQACRLRATLDALHGALASGDALAVLAAEPRLAAIVAEGPASPGALDDHERQAIRQELVRAQTALAQCRATGAAIADLAGVTWRATRRDAAYSSQGRPADGAAMRGRGLRARV